MKLAAFTKSILKRTSEFFQNIEKKKLIMIISLAIVIIAAGIIGATLLNQVKYTVLYSGLDASEAGTIKTVLDGKGIGSKVQGTSTILVPEDQADELRIQLASEGYPSTGLNYGIFEGSSQLGSTDLERRTLLQYQLQENIRSTLKHMDKVQDSIVIVNLASDSSFVVSENQSVASAAVTLKLRNGEMLTNTEAKAIGELVMKSVPGLKSENLSIVDSKMNYYDIQAEGGDTSSAYSSSQQQLTEQMKETMSKQVMRVLEPGLGSGNVAVSVNLNLNFDKESIDKIEFVPPVEGESEGLIRSSEEIFSSSGTAETTNGATGTDTNGLGTPAYVAGETPTGTDTNGSKTYNYELNEIRTQIMKEQGSLQNLSVAVLINSKVEGADGNVEKVKNLVAQAIGVESDYISVELMPFAENTSMEEAFNESQVTAQKESRNQLISTIVTIVAVLAAIVFIVKFVFGKPIHRTGEPVMAVAGSGSGGRVVGVTAGETHHPSAVETYDLSDLVLKRSTEAEKIEELMDRYPETVAQILRTWIAEDN